MSTHFSERRRGKEEDVVKVKMVYEIAPLYLF